MYLDADLAMKEQALAIAADRLKQPAPARARVPDNGGPAAATEPHPSRNGRPIKARAGRLGFFAHRNTSYEILRGPFAPAPLP